MRISPRDGLTVEGLMDLYFAYAETTRAIAPKTLFDYRDSAKSYVTPYLGDRRVADFTPLLISEWQQLLMRQGGRNGRGLSAGTVRLARAPLSSAWKWGTQRALVAGNPFVGVAPPPKPRKVAKHWTPEQARTFLSMMEGDRLYTVYASLLGSGLRIGELVWLRWPNVDLKARKVRVVEFASTLRYDVVAYVGKSRDAVRTVDLDDGLVEVLRGQRKQQAEEKLAAREFEDSDYVFTKPTAALITRSGFQERWRRARLVADCLG